MIYCLFSSCRLYWGIIYHIRLLCCWFRHCHKSSSDRQRVYFRSGFQDWSHPEEVCSFSRQTGRRSDGPGAASCRSSHEPPSPDPRSRTQQKQCLCASCRPSAGRKSRAFRISRRDQWHLPFSGRTWGSWQRACECAAEEQADAARIAKYSLY